MSVIRSAPMGRPRRTEPSILKVNGRGYWYCELPSGGRKWFGSDQEKAQDQYAKLIGQSTKLTGFGSAEPGTRSQRTKKNLLRVTGLAGTTVMPSAPSTAVSVQTVANDVFALVDCDPTISTPGKRDIRGRLKRFLAYRRAEGEPTFAERPISSLTAADFIAFRGSLAGLKPTYVNGILSSVKRLLNAAYENEYVDRPFRVAMKGSQTLKKLPRGPLPDKAIPIDKLKVLLREVAGVNPNVAKMMLLGFLGCHRPSMTPRLLHGLGKFRAEGIFSAHGKTSRKTGRPEDILVTPEALELLATIPRTYKHGKKEKVWCPSGSAYSHLCWRVGRKLIKKHKDKDFIKKLTGRADLRPHELRHSSYQILTDHVGRDIAETASTHTRPEVQRTYGKDHLENARQAIRVLSKLIPTETLGLKDSGPI